MSSFYIRKEDESIKKEKKMYPDDAPIKPFLT